jgi:two-component system phosphate regulon response regulator PhoB
MDATEPDITTGELLDKAKVLIVDDDPMTCRLLSLQLEMEGYPCVELSDPDRIMDVIRAESPALLLVDFHLGSYGGLELLQVVRDREEYRELPVVVMSGMDHGQESEEAGANGFVLKPFNLEGLLTTIQDALGRA